MDTNLTAEKRSSRGKNDARRLRRAGRIPAVVYGPPADGQGVQADPIAVDPKVLLRLLHSESGVNTLIGLRLGDDPETRVLVREFQLDPVTHEILHADFYKVAMDQLLTIAVPIELKGEPRGVKQQGGLLDFVQREIEVECLPGDIPEAIEVDVSEMLLGQSVRVRDLPESPKWKPVSDAETMIVHVVSPRVEEAAATEVVVAAPPAEPEVIKKGKTEKADEA